MTIRLADGRSMNVVLEVFGREGTHYVYVTDLLDGATLHQLSALATREYEVFEIGRWKQGTADRAARKAAKLAALGDRCVRCGSVENLEIDHIFPKSRGGTGCKDNLQLLCRRCNADKGARTMAEWVGAES